MNYKLVIGLWVIFAVSVVYWDMHRWDSKESLSVCHNAEIRMMNDRPMCTTCKLYCKVTNEKNR